MWRFWLCVRSYAMFICTHSLIRQTLFSGCTITRESNRLKVLLWVRCLFYIRFPSSVLSLCVFRFHSHLISHPLSFALLFNFSSVVQLSLGRAHKLNTHEFLTGNRTKHTKLHCTKWNPMFDGRAEKKERINEFNAIHVEKQSTNGTETTTTRFNLMRLLQMETEHVFILFLN